MTTSAAGLPYLRVMDVCNFKRCVQLMNDLRMLLVVIKPVSMMAFRTPWHEP